MEESSRGTPTSLRKRDRYRGEVLVLVARALSYINNQE